MARKTALKVIDQNDEQSEPREGTRSRAVNNHLKLKIDDLKTFEPFIQS